MAVKVKRERPDQRRHHRVSAPLFVRVGPHDLRAVDWSLTGLKVDDYPEVPPELGTELTLQLTLPFQGFDVSFNVNSVVARRDPARATFAVRFTELGERERELMQHFVEELVRGSMVDIEDTIQRIDVPVTPASLEPDLPRPVQMLPAHRIPIKTAVMSGLYILLGLIVFGYAGLIGYSNFFRMEVQTAVISAPVETVTAQTDGKVAWAGVKPGDQVKAGEVIVNVMDAQLEREVELAEIGVQERKARLVYLKRRHADELDRIRGFATVEMKNVEQTKVDVDSLASQLKLAEQQHRRLVQLQEKGYTTLIKVEETERQVIALRQALASRRIELASRVDLAEQDIGKRLYTGDDIIGKSGEYEAEVRLGEHEIALAEQRVASILNQRERQSVRSPFDGTILELPRVDNGSVARGDVIAIIEQRRERQVTAWLNQDEVLKIGLGDEALIYVPALGETLKGRVSQIDRTSGFVREQEQRQNPGYAWRGPSDRSAKVTIEFEDPAKVADIERYRAGLPVVVVFERRATNSILSGIAKKLAVAL
jgi:multidrug resistance efflux pump